MKSLDVFIPFMNALSVFDLQLSCGNNVLFFPYLVDNNKTCVVVENSTLPQNCCVHPEKGQQSLFVQLKKKLSEMEKENT